MLMGVNEGSDAELAVTFDGVELASFDVSDAATFADYALVSVPVTVAAEGNYLLSFNQTKSTIPWINFFIDDVSMTPVVSGPALSASGIDFGVVATGGSMSADVTIENIGDETVNISSITVDGDGFSIDDTSTDTELEAGESTTVEVTFAPTVAGAATGSISVASNDPNSPTVATLTGAGGDPPANDDIADATAISAFGTYTGNNFFASLEADEPVPSCQTNQGASVFWAYTPAADGFITIDLSNSDFDTILTFHQADGTEISCDDDGGTATRSLLEGVEVTGGTTYLIRVAGFSAAEGNISFDISDAAPPRTLAASYDGSTDRGPYDRAFVGATSGTCSVSGTGAAVMYGTYDITVAQAGTFDITVRDFALDPVLTVYTGGSFDPAAPCTGIISYEDSNGDANGETEENLDLAAGTYTIVVSGYQSTDTGSYTVDIFGENVTVVGTERVENAQAFSLSTPRPNPASGVAQVSLSTDAPQHVSVVVYDLLGRSVVVLHDGQLAAGSDHTFRVNGSVLPSGQYIVRAQGESYVSTQRLTVVR